MQCSDRLQARGVGQEAKTEQILFFPFFFFNDFNSQSLMRATIKTSKGKINTLEKEKHSSDRFDSTPDCALLLRNIPLSRVLRF